MNILGISLKDTAKSAVSGALGAAAIAIILTLHGAIQQPDFSFATMNWALVLNAALAAFIGDLARRFTTDTKHDAVIGTLGSTK
jgi:hypothetical protein